MNGRGRTAILVLAAASFVGAACSASTTSGSTTAESQQLPSYETLDAMPRQEQSETIAGLLVECLRERGFTAEVEDGGLTMELGPQREEQLLAHDSCMEELREKGVLRATPPSEAELRRQYHFLLRTADCLEELGFVVSAPPSESTFVESLGAAWHPYLSLPVSLSQRELIDIEERCPQT